MRRLLTRADFDEAIAPGSVIVVTDSANGTRIHCPPCRWVKASYFETKVIVGRGKNGAYYACASSTEAQDSFGNVPCRHCLASPPSGATRPLAHQLGSFASSAPPGPERAVGVNYVVRRAADNDGVVEAWARERLNFLPDDWREAFRVELGDALRELEAGTSKMLLAAFTSPERGTFDIENVLFFNLEREWNAGADRLEHCASTAVIFERSYEMPSPSPDGRTFPHHHRYELADSDSLPRFWMPGRTIAKWAGIRSGPPSSWARGAHVWRWMRRAELDYLAKPTAPPDAFGVRLTFSGPAGQLNLLRAVKPCLDGIVLSFQAEDGRSDRAGIEKHAAHVGLSFDETELLLRDSSRAVLGHDRLLLKSGQMNPCDHKCVAVELRRGPVSEDWLLAGELYEALPRG